MKTEPSPPAEVLVQAGNFQRSAGRYADAERLYKQALQIDPPLPGEARAEVLDSLTAVQREQQAVSQTPPPQNITAPPAAPEKPKGLSTAAKTAIGVAILAVVVGGTLGIYLYAQKSSSKMETDFSGIQIQNAY